MHKKTIQDNIKIVIADDNTDVCNLLCDFFDKIEDINVCAVANNGIDAIDSTKKLKPDILLLDIVMPNMDGIEVLKSLKNDQNATAPQFIMMSAIGQENILKEAFLLGVSYYMIKPFKLNFLEERIRKIYGNYVIFKNTAGQFTESLDLKIVRNVIDVGIPTNVLGYKYITGVLKVMLNSAQHILLSEIYSVVADKNCTTVQCVESAIRNAIYQASKKSNVNYSLLFSQESLSGDKKPTNSQFLSKLAENIKIAIF